MASVHIVGQIKREVEDAYERKYSCNNDKKHLRYYSLYLPNIVAIQRAFRAYLMRKNAYLEAEIEDKLEERVRLHKMRK